LFGKQEPCNDGPVSITATSAFDTIYKSQ